MSDAAVATATTQQKRPATMKGGTAHVGLLVNTPDGRGRVAAILNPDTVMVELEGRTTIHPLTKQPVPVKMKLDLSECVALEALRLPPPEPETTPVFGPEEVPQAPQPPPSTPEGAVV